MVVTGGNAFWPTVDFLCSCASETQGPVQCLALYLKPHVLDAWVRKSSWWCKMPDCLGRPKQ